MPLERAVVSRIRRDLESRGAKCIKTSGEGEPDLICCVGGQTYAIECKQPGETPRRLQIIRLQEWARSGAFAAWTDGKQWHDLSNPSVGDNGR